MRVLVTGHNGYVGSAMLPVLDAAGHTLTGLDTFFFEDCTLTPDVVRVPSEHVDIRSLTATDLEGFEAVVHLAAVPDNPRLSHNGENIAEINHRAAVRVARHAREAGVGRFLYASSCNVYGQGGREDALSEDAPRRPASPASTAKARAEDEILELADQSFSPVVMRIATAYGVSPRLRADTLLNRLVCWAYTSGRVIVSDDLPPWRPLVHVEDVAYAFAAALASPREVVHGQAFNVGSDSENYQLSELIETVLGTVPGSAVEHVERSGEKAHAYRISFGKMTRAFTGFRPRWNAAFGAKDLYAALQDAAFAHADLQDRYSRAASLERLVASGRLDPHLWRRPVAVARTR